MQQILNDIVHSTNATKLLPGPFVSTYNNLWNGMEVKQFTLPRDDFAWGVDLIIFSGKAKHLKIHKTFSKNYGS